MAANLPADVIAAGLRVAGLGGPNFAWLGRGGRLGWAGLGWRLAEPEPCASLSSSTDPRLVLCAWNLTYPRVLQGVLGRSTPQG